MLEARMKLTQLNSIGQVDSSGGTILSCSTALRPHLRDNLDATPGPHFSFVRTLLRNHDRWQMLVLGVTRN